MEKRDEIISFIDHWKVRSEFPQQRILDWLNLSRGRYHQWRRRKGKPNRHNSNTPKSHHLLPEERDAIIHYAQNEGLQAGYRRMSYLMMDANIAAVSPSSTYRVLKEAGLIQPWGKPSKKGTGFHPTTCPSRALAYRLHLSQTSRHLLLPSNHS